MFRKLVSNLPFSPALVGQLGFYARRLKKEETTRRLGLIFTALALIVQSFAVFAPPESANAASASDFIYGGVKNKQQLLDVYDKSANGNGDYKDILDYAGITRAELAAVTPKTINSQDYGKGDNAWLTWGRQHRFSTSQGEVKHIIPRANGETTTVYSKPFWLYDTNTWSSKHGSDYEAFVGHSAKLGTFAVVKGCGNIITRKTPKPVPAASFISATCDLIKGSAYDGRNKNLSVKVYLYFGGAPGQGDKSPAIATSGKDNSFEFKVPDTYRKKASPTKVWGVMVPLAGWNDSTVQFKNTATIPGNCVKPQPKPAATCTGLQLRLIERTKISLIGTASTENGAKIKSYTFSVSGKANASKVVNSTTNRVDSGVIELKDAGAYKATLTVQTSVGDVTSTTCTKAFTISPPEVCQFNPDLPKNSPLCAPCPGNPEIWIKDEDCNPVTTQSKTAQNLTQNTDATTVIAQAGDRIQYTLTYDNIGQVPATVNYDEELGDVLEYASIQDNGGGTFNDQTKILSWGAVTLQPGEKQNRSFTIQVTSPIPVTPVGNSEPSSYDCIMTNAFGNTIDIRVNCESPKIVEQTIEQLPSTGPTENMLFGGIIAVIVTFFWARSRQMNKEVRLIRKDLNMGTI